jgi:hypothetical protein
MNLGDSFLMEYPRGGVKHLFIVVHKASDRILLVNVSSLKVGVECDTSCVLRQGEHPFIDHDSFVVYSQVFFALESYIDGQIRHGICKRQDPVTNDVLERIGRGAAISESIPEKYRQYFDSGSR